MTREEAIEVYHDLINEKIKEAFEFFAPELRESEDERIRKELVSFFKAMQDSDWHEKYWHDLEIVRILAYLEKHKEDKEELVYRLNGLMQEYIKAGKDDAEKDHRYECYLLFWDALEDSEFFKKEQKPAEWSEEKAINDIMPILNDIANQGTFGNPTKERMEEFAKKILKSIHPKPKQEWSEEDEEMSKKLIQCLRGQIDSKPDMVSWLKDLRSRMTKSDEK